MNEKYLWPLAGVFVGWVLTAISAGYRERSNKKQLIGALITKLIRVKYQLDLVITATEKMKGFADNWEDYEPIRQYMLERYFLSPKEVLADLESAINNVAPLYPVLAVELESLYELLIQSKENKLTASCKNADAYIRMLSIYEVGFDACSARLNKYVLKLSLKHKVTTYVQIKLMFMKQARNRTKMSKSAEALMSEIRSVLKKSTHNKSKQENANKAGASV